MLTLAGGGAGYAIANTDDDPAPAPDATEAAKAAPPKFRSRPDLRTLPDVTITVPANATAPGYIFLTPASGTGLWGPLIVDDKGSPIWFKKVPDPATVAIDFKVQQYRGKQVLTWWEGTIGGTGGQGVGQGEFVIADQNYREITRVRAAGTEQADQHDFVITPKGTALFWVYDPIPYDLTSMGGPADGVLHDGVIQEIDIATGQRVFEWRARDHVALDESYAPLPQGESAKLPWDYFHPNSVGLDADGHLIISARHTWTCYKINKESGEVMWRLGGKKSDFTIGQNANFSWQHDFRRRRDGSYGMFDNGAGVTKEREYSRGLVLKLDEQAKTATFVRGVRAPGQDLRADPGQLPRAGRRRELHRLGPEAELHRVHRRRHGPAGRAPAAGQPVLPGVQVRVGRRAAGPAGPGPARRERQRGGQRELERHHEGGEVAGPGRRPAQGAAPRRSRPPAPASRPP